MFKTTVKYLLTLTFFTVFAATALFGQTINIGNPVNSDSYTPGARVSIPFHITSGYFPQGNVFSLYISDVNTSNFNTPAVATINSFYGNSFNYTLPAGTVAGNYRFQVRASAGATTAASGAIQVTPGTTPIPSISAPGPQVITAEVFGKCNGTQATPYTFTNTSTNATSVTLTIFDESGATAVQVGAAHDITITPFAFTAGAKNYRLVVAATDGGSGLVSTRSYQLINNNVTTSLGSTGSNIACIDPLTNQAVFSFSVDVASATGIQNNYPGNTYPVTWGDGNTTIYTLGEIVAAGGLVSHTYTTVSCGQIGSTTATNNRFRVDFNASNPSCGTIGSPSTGYATIVVKPVNRIGTPTLSTTGNVCAGSNMTFVNLSIPGPDANSTNTNCVDNPFALYTWLVDGNPVLSNVSGSTPFVYNNIPKGAGNHVITLRDVSGNGQCFADDVVFNLCVQSPPQPAFTVPATAICNTAFSPIDASVVDNSCTPVLYTWSVTPSAGVGFTGGTNANSLTPQFTFPAAGTYTINLSISSASCGPVAATPHNVVVDATPTAILEPDASYCATQTLTFNGTAGSKTRVRFTGTTAASLALSPTTIYTWTVTGPGNPSFSFVGGTNSHSQFPQIKFDDFATYTVTVTHTNSCGTISDSQDITFQEAPIVDAGPTQIICEPAVAAAVNLTGTITGTYNTSSWSVIMGSNAASLTTPNNSLTAGYTPNAADFTRGFITLRLTATTPALPSPCNQVTDDVTITLIRTTVRTSATTKTICSGDNVNYTITTNNDAFTPAPTFAWTAAVTSGTVTGFTAAGTTQLISDVLVNSNPTVTATVTYHITPSTNGCAGTPFDLVVTLNAVPVVTPARASAAICSNNPAGITMTSSLANTRYTWTVSAPSGSGASDNLTPTTNAFINQTLFNNTGSAITVTYTITPYNADGCPGTPVPISVDVNTAPSVANAGTSQILCGATSYILQATPAVGTEVGKWTVVTGTGLTFLDDTDPHTTVSGLVDGQNYTLRWTITTITNCQSSSTVNLSVTPATVGGTTAGATTICSGTSGNITLSGHVGSILKWQRSIDAGANWIDVANTTTTLTYTNLTQTTHYRAVVQSGTCATLNSTESIVTVNPPTPQATITGGGTQAFCAQTIITLTGNNPAGYTGQWTQTAGPAVTIDNPTNFTTTITGLTGGISFTAYTFVWTINGASPCPSTTATVNVTDYAASVGGATATTDPTTVCSGSNTGTINLTGQLGTVIRWEQSINGGTNWTSIINTANSYSFSALTASTQFRAVVQNTGSCAEAFSSPTTITVNQPTPTAVVNANQRLCNFTSATLTGNLPVGYTGQWTQTAGTTVTIDNPTSATTTVSGLVGGNTYTFMWTINGLAPCGPSSASTTIINDPATVAGTTSGVATVCAGSNAGQITLAGQTGAILYWETSTDGTTWTNAGGIGSTTFAYNTLLTTTSYRAVVQSGVCTPPLTSTVTTITVNPPTPTAVIAGGDQRLCNLPGTTLTANNPGILYTARWTQTAGDPVTIDNPNSATTTISGMVGGKSYTFSWTIDGLAPCGPSTAFVNVINDAATVPGTTATINPTIVCSGSNGGQITLSGQVGTILRWEQSTDGNTWVTVNPLNTSTSLSYLNLTETTSYRVVVQSGVCSPPQTSTVTKITVNPPAPIANAGAGQTLCNIPTFTLTGNDPGVFPGVWTQTAGPAVTITNPNNFQTTVTGATGGNIYTFTWTITPLLPCTPTSSQVTINNQADVIASFTASPKVGCGPLTVNFTNTSNNQPGANFQWNFGDGSQSTAASPSHTFAQRTDGRDTTYYITLKVVGNCTDRPAIIDSVLVRPATPIARILPASTNGCGNFAIDVLNTSPGNNTKYDFYLYNGTTLVQHITKTDKSNALFDPITTAVRTTFTLYMVATGYCNNTNETTHIPIVISPSDVVGQMFVQNGISSGCGPLSVVFVNNSRGGNNFVYNIYNSNNVVIDRPIAGTTSLPYTFTTPGTYYVTITATSACGVNESPRTRIDVFAVPKPAFVADITTGCRDIRVTFANNTTTGVDGTPAASLIYDWDFGDGTPHSASFQPTHAYHFRSTPYTVTLRATNTASGCTDIFVRTAYINVTSPPQPAFIVRPDSVISIPNYTFSFVDQTTGNPTAWRWTFSDGHVSTQRNPTITFRDTGVYRVTLLATNTTGCDSAVTKTVRVTGVPGQLYLPNAFMPNSLSNDLKTFKAKGSGISKWHLQIFNNYGQLVWETTGLTSKGEPVGEWDGTFKGMPMPQGVYQWQASATFINGTEWKGNSYKDELPKRVGSIHLLR